MDIKSLKKLYKPTTGVVEMDSPWDKKVHIKALDGRGMNEVVQATQNKIGEVELMAIAVINSVTDKDGKKIFKPDELEDLMQLDGADIIKLGSEIMGLTEKANSVDPKGSRKKKGSK